MSGKVIARWFFAFLVKEAGGYLVKFSYVLLFLILLWISNSLALPDVLGIFLAIFIPFGILGAVSGLLHRKGESLRIAALRGARNQVLVSFFFCVGLSSVAFLFALRVGNAIRPAIAQLPVLTLACLAVVHMALKAAEGTRSPFSAPNREQPPPEA
jgi:hypothetical protein